MELVVWMAWLALGAAELGPPTPGTTVPPPITAPAVTETANGALVIDLRTALELGLDRARAIRIARQDAISARAGETQATGALQPQIGLDGSYSRSETAVDTSTTGTSGSTDNESHSVSVSVEQLIFDGMQSIYSAYSAHQTARAAVYSELSTRLDTAGQVVDAFFAVLRNDALLRLDEQLVAQAERSHAATVARRAQGLSSDLDVRRSEVSVANARVEMTASQNAYTESVASLRNLLLIPRDTPLQVVDTIPVPPVELELEEALTAAVAEQPTISAAAARLRGQRHNLSAAQWRRWLNVQVSAGYERYLDSSRDLEQNWQLSASFSIPLWDGQSGEARETAARASARRAEEQYRQALEQAALAVETAWLNWSDASARLVYAEDAAQLAAQTLRETEESYALNVASLLDVNDSRTEYSRAEANRIQARFDRDLSSINLRLAVGRLPLAPVTEEDGDA